MLTIAQVLLAYAILTFIVVMVQGAIGTSQNGPAWGLGPRDEERPRSKLLGRADRTVANHLQGAAMFLPVAAVALTTDAGGQLVVAGANLFLVARILFAVIYLAGTPVVRTLAFGAGVTGLGMMVVGLWPAVSG